MRRGILVAMISSWLLPAAAATARGATSFYDYEVSGYPPNGMACADAAKALGDRLATATGVTVYRTECVQETRAGFDLDVTYVADRPLTVESTHDLTDQARHGNYQTLSECEADLSAQTALFQTSTGLTPFVAYCYLEEDLPPDAYPASFWIDAFGAARNHLQDAVVDLGVMDEVSDPDAVQQQMADLVTKAGVAASRVFLMYESVYLVNELHVEYYGERNYVNPIDWSQLLFSSESNCRTQFEAARAIFGSTDNPASPLLVCGPEGDESYRLHVITLNPSALHADRAPQTFSSLTDCMNGEAAVFTDYRNLLHWTVVGGLCGGLNGDNQLYVFGTPNAASAKRSN